MQAQETENTHAPVIDGETPYYPAAVTANLWELYAPTDVELRKGRVVVPLQLTLANGLSGVITSTPDNARNGILVNNGTRLVKSNVISMAVCGELDVVIDINEDTLFVEQTNLGARTRNVFIPAGTPIARLFMYAD